MGHRALSTDARRFTSLASGTFDPSCRMIDIDPEATSTVLLSSPQSCRTPLRFRAVREARSNRFALT